MNAVKGELPRWVPLLASLLLMGVVWQWGSAGWIYGKAYLAQSLIARAWDHTLRYPPRPVKPWPWADTWPVARLLVPRLGVELYVLEGAQGNSLAFGPGHHQGTPLPGAGTSVIGGHRDTHFRFLKNLAVGDALQVQIASGERLTYRVRTLEIVDIRFQPLQLDLTQQGLLLVTCYPFTAIVPHGPLRYLVWAEAVNPDDAG